ncbi:hypothetical protein BJ508DRAFT_336907 [Ascobolus immersus RN42]|uniref:Uncharacterized protein n=1 Tax=Ascobolus immersus RN42 TaxID=1160509 RepID=A0A3N4H6Y0_ASCIM|nr:hypothetical protein BJ508DRAFT_336907 [Ascobolus immersus RN42]
MPPKIPSVRMKASTGRKKQGGAHRTFSQRITASRKSKKQNGTKVAPTRPPRKSTRDDSGEEATPKPPRKSSRKAPVPTPETQQKKQKQPKQTTHSATEKAAKPGNSREQAPPPPPQPTPALAPGPKKPKPFRIPKSKEVNDALDRLETRQKGDEKQEYRNRDLAAYLGLTKPNAIRDLKAQLGDYLEETHHFWFHYSWTKYTGTSRKGLTFTAQRYLISKGHAWARDGQKVRRVLSTMAEDRRRMYIAEKKKIYGGLPTWLEAKLTKPKGKVSCLHDVPLEEGECYDWYASGAEDNDALDDNLDQLSSPLVTKSAASTSSQRPEDVGADQTDAIPEEYLADSSDEEDIVDAAAGGGSIAYGSDNNLSSDPDESGTEDAAAKQDDIVNISDSDSDSDTSTRDHEEEEKEKEQMDSHVEEADQSEHDEYTILSSDEEDTIEKKRTTVMPKSILKSSPPNNRHIEPPATHPKQKRIDRFITDAEARAREEAHDKYVEKMQARLHDIQKIRQKQMQEEAEWEARDRKRAAETKKEEAYSSGPDEGDQDATRESDYALPDVEVTPEPANRLAGSENQIERLLSAIKGGNGRQQAASSSIGSTIEVDLEAVRRKAKAFKPPFSIPLDDTPRTPSRNPTARRKMTKEAQPATKSKSTGGQKVEYDVLPSDPPSFSPVVPPTRSGRKVTLTNKGRRNAIDKEKQDRKRKREKDEKNNRTSKKAKVDELKNMHELSEAPIGEDGYDELFDPQEFLSGSFFD